MLGLLVACLSAAGFSLFKLRRDRIQFWLAPPFWLTASFGLVILCAALDPAASQITQQRSLTIAIPYILGYSMATILLSPKRCAIFLVSFASIAVAQSAIAAAVGKDLFLSGQSYRLEGALGNPLELATISGAGLLAMLAPPGDERLFSKPFHSTALAILLLLGTAFTLSRGPLIAVSVTSFIYYHASRKPYIFKWALGCTITAGAIWFLRSLGGAGARSTAGSNFGHLDLMKRGLGAFRSSPWTGVGFQQMDLTFTRGMPGMVIYRNFATAKSLYISLLAQLGVIGVGFLVWAYALASLVRRKFGQRPRWALFPTLAIFILTCGLVDEPCLAVDRPAGNALLGFILGIGTLEYAVRKEVRVARI